jgi:DNA-directed RNA polymerase subunit M/transcription elongation factor TFIIS
MTIKFCKNCNTILKIANKNNRQYLVCSKCETIEVTKDNLSLTTKIPKKQKTGSGAAEKNPKLGYDFKCKKCGNNKCELIDLGIMYGDEDWIYLLQCTKCDYAERVGETA